LLQAAVGRQSVLLAKMNSGQCKFAFETANASAEFFSRKAISRALSPVQDATNRIDSLFGLDLSSAKVLIAASRQAIAKK